jgi:hypothetical protein
MHPLDRYLYDIYHEVPVSQSVELRRFVYGVWGCPRGG